ncbi:MAG TPA: exopolysaccharide biosynthesis polyprenyl glycosylphosphotransferase [Roseiflexaceae bacterium]|nr:exopolysaccharide biosynthesis polyprenyl glycosylphosphotransferase [Roseiflexaceae bacterium]
MIWLFFMTIVWLLLLLLVGCYDLPVAGNQSQTVTRVILATFVAGFLYLLLFFVFGRPAILVGEPPEPGLTLFDLSLPPRLIPGLLVLLGVPLLIVWRLSYIQFFTSPAMRRHAVIVGSSSSGSALVHDTRSATKDYEFVGFIDEDPALWGTNVQGLKVMGNYDVLTQLIKAREVDEVIVALPKSVEGELFQALIYCHERGTTIRSMSKVYEEVLGQVPVEHLGSYWFLDGSTSNFPIIYRACKRLVDISVGLIGLAILALLFPWIAIAIYLDSPGPLFYRQERHGQYGKRFWVLKFRSMIPDAEKVGLEKLGLDRWTEKDDPRVTRVGRLLRRARFDELPQVINILKGDMSLVGPRPEVSRMVESLDRQIPFYRLRWSIKPGLTGWAQVCYRYGSTIEDALVKLKYDLYYIKHQSLRLDLLIIFRTIAVVLAFRGS